jgi:RNA polymerase sigma factor (sigma-70 family)
MSKRKTNNDFLSVQTLAERYMESASEIDFNNLYYRLRPGLVLYLKKMIATTKNPYINIEDIIADTFTLVYRKIYQYKKEFAFSTWVYRIAYTQFIQNLRDTKNLIKPITVESLEFFLGQNNNDSNDENEKSKYFDIVDDYDINLNREYVFLDAYKKILQTIMNYGISGKLVIDQKVNNLSTLEIANKYNMNHSTVRVKIHKVMQDVRLDLKKSGIKYEEFGF